MHDQLGPHQLGGDYIEFTSLLPESGESLRTLSTTALPSTSPSSRSPAREVNQTHDNYIKFRDAVEVTMNPFENTPRLTCYELLKRLAVGLTLFPLRVVIFICVVLLSALWARLVMVGMPLVEDRGCWMHKEPLPRWRSRLAVPIRYFFRMFLWCHGLLWIKVTDHREHSFADSNIVVAGPHVTMLDMFVLMYVFPGSGFLGQAHLVKNPLLLPIGTITQGLYIDLKDKGSRNSCKEGVATRASSDWRGGKLIIFPEGTITNGQQFVQFKAGAFSPGTPVLPVLLRYPWQSYDISWVGQNRDCLWGFRCALQLINYCEVDILDVYIPSEEEQDNAIMFANNVRGVMAKHVGLPTTEHSYDDVFFYREAALRANVGNDFVIKEMKSLFDADMETLKSWLELFKIADEHKAGYLSMHQLQSVLKCDEESEDIHRLFNFFDTDHSGTIEYREFVQILALLSGKSSGNDLAKLAFLLYDTNNEGFIDKQLLIRALDNTFQARRWRRSRRRRGLVVGVGLEDSDDESSTTSTATNLEMLLQSMYDDINGRSGASNREVDKELDVFRAHSCEENLELSPKKNSSLDGFSDRVSWEEFCEILRRNPEVLEAAVGDMRRSIREIGVGPVRSIREIAQSVTARTP